jgi:hypothetical protein
MLNNAELEEEIDDAWEHFLLRYSAPRLHIHFEEPTCQDVDGTWIWMEADGYSILTINHLHMSKIVTQDLDEAIFKAIYPSLQDLASTMEGSYDDNILTLSSYVSERCHIRALQELSLQTIK